MDRPTRLVLWAGIVDIYVPGNLSDEQRECLDLVVISNSDELALRPLEFVPELWMPPDGGVGHDESVESQAITCCSKAAGKDLPVDDQ